MILIMLAKSLPRMVLQSTIALDQFSHNYEIKTSLIAFFLQETQFPKQVLYSYSILASNQIQNAILELTPPIQVLIPVFMTRLILNLVLFNVMAKQRISAR